MHRWRHPTSTNLWVAAHPAPSDPRGCCPEAIETGLSSKSPPAVRHHRLPPKLLPVRVQATSSIPDPANLLQLGTRGAQRILLKKCIDLARSGGGGRAVPGRSPEGLYTSILHRLLPLSCPEQV